MKIAGLLPFLAEAAVPAAAICLGAVLAHLFPHRRNP